MSSNSFFKSEGHKFFDPLPNRPVCRSLSTVSPTHLSALKQGLQIVDEVILVIGSANKNFSLNNPLTIDERLEILKTVINTEKLKSKIKLLTTIDDIPDNLA